MQKRVRGILIEQRVSVGDIRNQTMEIRTRRHVIYTASSEFFAPNFPCSKTEVSQSNSHLLGIPATAFDFLVGIPTEDVLGLQIAVVDAALMTPLDGIDKLEEHVADALTMSQKRLFVKNLGEEITAGCEIHNDVSML